MNSQRSCHLTTLSWRLFSLVSCLFPRPPSVESALLSSLSSAMPGGGTEALKYHDFLATEQSYQTSLQFFIANFIQTFSLRDSSFKRSFLNEDLLFHRLVFHFDSRDLQVICPASLHPPFPPSCLHWEQQHQQSPAWRHLRSNKLLFRSMTSLCRWGSTANTFRRTLRHSIFANSLLQISMPFFFKVRIPTSPLSLIWSCRWSIMWNTKLSSRSSCICSKGSSSLHRQQTQLQQEEQQRDLKRLKNWLRRHNVWFSKFQIRLTRSYKKSERSKSCWQCRVNVRFLHLLSSSVQTWSCQQSHGSKSFPIQNHQQQPSWLHFLTRKKRIIIQDKGFELAAQGERWWNLTLLTFRHSFLTKTNELFLLTRVFDLSSQEIHWN